MRYLAGFMMFAFALAGSGLIVAAVRELALKLRRRKYFRRTTGSIVRVERERHRRRPGEIRRRVAQYRFFPVVKFRNEAGAEIVFRSETGDGGRVSKYRVGQRLPVVYDPDDRVPPMIDTFAGVWLPVVFLLLAGIVFAGGALTIFFAFGARIFGGG
ncbi:MAG: DUF3592 domain-containing protein [Acidobacteria bacterium]|nr:DUF3592 domain-containing protein [Acidobacteriota bacterium]